MYEDNQLAYAMETMTLDEAREVVKKRNGNNSTIIYRSGSGNNTNLTPRTLADDNGLSYFNFPNFDDKGRCTITTVEAINATGVLKCVQDPSNPKHYLVVPVNISDMPKWQATRTTALIKPHPYTLLLQSISIKVK